MAKINISQAGVVGIAAGDEIARLRAENERLVREGALACVKHMEANERATQAEATAAACVGALEYYGEIYNYGKGVGDGYFDPTFVWEEKGQKARDALSTLPARAVAMAEVVKAAEHCAKMTSDPVAAEYLQTQLNALAKIDEMTPT